MSTLSSQSIYLTFHHHDLSDQEVLEGSKLSSLQVMCFQSIQAGYAEELIALEVDTSDPQGYFIKKANLQGKIEAIRNLLVNSDNAING